MPERPSSQLPLRPEKTPAERGAELEAFSREVEREILWDRVRTICSCILSSAIGSVGMGAAVASTDLRVAPVIFWGSFAVGMGGVMFSLIGAMWREERRNGGW
jgi:hypothetical protein